MNEWHDWDAEEISEQRAWWRKEQDSEWELDCQLRELGAGSNHAMVQRDSYLRVSERLIRAVDLPGRKQ